MKRFCLSLIFYFVLLGFISCQTSMTRYGEESPPVSAPAAETKVLEDWVENELADAIVKILEENRDVRHRPFVIVGWDYQKQTLKTEIDQLSNEIREMMIGVLMRQQNDDLRLVMRAPPVVQKHHDDKITCADYREVGLYVILKTRYSELKRAIVIEVNGVLLEGEKFRFVQGLSEKIRLKADARMLSMLNTTVPDEYLRGLRYLPFAAGQKDLMASYLVCRLICTFSENMSRDDYIVYMDKNRYENNPFLDDIFDLVGHYLNKYREIEVVSDRQQANIFLSCSSSNLAGELQQVWISSEGINNHKLGPAVVAYIKKK